MKDCPDKEFKATQSKLGTPPPEECCGTETILPIPDELREPVGEGFQAEVKEYITKPILIWNKKVRVECTEAGTEGLAVEVEEKRFSTKLYFSSILSIPEDVLTYIAKHNLEPTIETGIHQRTLTAERLKELTGMTIRQGQEFLQIAYDLQDQQDTYAENSARLSLDCSYWNTAQTAKCEDDKMAKPSEFSGAVFEATTPAHTYSSSVSQEDADEQAYNAAQALLKCFYVNDGMTVTCATWPERPQDYDEEVPNDATEVYPGKGKRVGKVEIPASLFDSYAGKEDANDRALEWGYSQLVCWFPNDEVRVECADPQARSLGVDPSKSPQAMADLVTGKTGQIVVVPEGYITSELSRKVATEEARLLANSLLECCFINDPFVLKCTPQTVRTLENKEIDINPDPTRGVTEFRVNAGDYVSCLSKEDANSMAQQVTEGVLECYYCNPEVEPECLPDWIKKGIASGKIHVPLEAVITDGEHITSLSALPPEATVGAKEGSVCILNDAQMALEIAEAAGGVHSTDQGSFETCIYTSDAVYATCAGTDPFHGSGTVKIGEPNYMVHPDTGEAYMFYTAFSPDTCISNEYSRPVAEEYIAIPAGMFAAAGDSMKEECNARALDFALSQVFCAFSSPEVEGTCEGVTEMRPNMCDTLWEVGKGKKEDANRLASWANSKNHPIRLPEGFVLYIGNNYDEAMSSLYSMAVNVVHSMLQCIYTNREISAGCGELINSGYLDHLPSGCAPYVNPATRGYVEAETVYAESAQEADAIATQMATAIGACEIDTICLFNEELIWPEKPPMPDIPPHSHPDSISIHHEPWHEESSSSSSPGHSSSTGNFDDWLAQFEDCCYYECPLFPGFPTEQTGLEGGGRRIYDIESTRQKISATVADRLLFLEEKANGLLSYTNTLIEQYEKR